MDAMIGLVNQLFEIEQKTSAKDNAADVSRNIERAKNHLDEMGFRYHSPLNERYSDTRTDCSANIVGQLVDNAMYISKVIKPIVYQRSPQGGDVIVQKAVVIVENKA